MRPHKMHFNEIFYLICSVWKVTRKLFYEICFECLGKMIAFFFLNNLKLFAVDKNYILNKKATFKKLYFK